MKYLVILVGAMVGGCAGVQSSKIETQSIKAQMPNTFGAVPSFDPKTREAASLATRKAYCGNRHVMHHNGVNPDPAQVAKQIADDNCKMIYSEVEERGKAH
jgi:hypothetical protein